MSVEISFLPAPNTHFVAVALADENSDSSSFSSSISLTDGETSEAFHSAIDSPGTCPGLLPPTEVTSSLWAAGEGIKVTGSGSMHNVTSSS